MKKLYKIINEKIIESPVNKKHKLIDASIETPDGTEVVWQYIKSRDVVTIVAINDNKEIYCVRQWRPARKSLVWELPAGGVEIDNPPVKTVLENANRELQEEIGLKANSMKLLATFTPSIHMTSRFYVVLATKLTESTLPKDQDEDLDIKVLPFKEAFDLLITKQTPSAMTLVGMLFAKEFLNIKS